MISHYDIGNAHLEGTKAHSAAEDVSFLPFFPTGLLDQALCNRLVFIKLLLLFRI